MAQLIATGTAEANAEFTIVDGQSANLNMFVAPGANLVGCIATVQIKASNGECYDIGELTREQPAKVVSGAGTYRVVRRASSTSFGVDKT